MAWVLTSYIVASAIMIPLSGWLAGQLGRRRIFLYSVVGFTVASVFCGLAQSLPQLVSARVLQGVFGAALVPMSQAVLLDINPSAHHGRAMAIWVMAAMVGPIVGPALGGWLTENYNWRWVFYINVPVGILSFIGTLSAMPETATRKAPFDFFGFVALSTFIGALQFMLDRGQLKDWFDSTEIWIEAVTAAVALYLFIIHMLTTTQAPFVNPLVFRDRNFLAGNLFMFVIGIVIFATLALIAPLLQDLLGYPVLTTGLVTAPRGVGTVGAMLIVGRIMGRIDARLIIGTGFALTAFSAWQMSHFDLQMDAATVVWSGLAQGLGTGFAFVPLAAAAFATLSPTLRNEGTAIFSLIRNLGSSIGISAVETLLTRNTQIMHASLAEHVNRYNPILRSQLTSGVLDPYAVARLNTTVTQQAAMIAYNNNFRFMMIMTLAAIPLVFVMRKAGAVKPEPVALE
jgi:MFS transporter, DHA2 family, multidrug resistance protein